MSIDKNENRPVTIKSIAQELGISFSTVSKALNGNPVIKEETRDLVKRKAEEMGYTPNSLAKGLRGNSTKTIAVIFNDIENPSLTYIFRNISIEMAKHGYTTMIFDSQFNLKSELANIHTVLSRQPDFIIWEPATTSSDGCSLLNGMEDKLIIQGLKSDHLWCHNICVDYAKGGYQAACEMLSNGHRDCLVMTVPLSFPSSRQFVLGIKKAYEEYQIPFDEDMVMTLPASINNAFQTLQNLWDPRKGCFSRSFTGILTFDDMLAHGVYKAAAQFGLNVPDDISVIGFDDNPLSAFSMPPLTTVHLPKEKMAESCLDILRSALLEKNPDICFFSLEPYLIARQSVRNLLKKF